MIALLAMLSITCSFGGLLPGAATSGKLRDGIVAIEPGGSVDNNGAVVDTKYIFAPSDPQMEVVVQVGTLSSPAPLTVTWVQVTDQGDQTLFTHTVQVGALDRAYSIGKNPGTLAEGDYKIVAALNGETRQIELSVAQPTQGQPATTSPTPTSGGGPPVDGGSGKTASAASSYKSSSAGNAPASSGCIVNLYNWALSNQDDFAPGVDIDANSNCPQQSDITATVDGAPTIIGIAPPIGKNGSTMYGPYFFDPCALSGGKDLPGTKITFDAGPNTSSLTSTSGTGITAKAGPYVITLGPDLSPPHLDPNPSIKGGTRVHQGNQIKLNITAEEVPSGESWQTGVQDIQVFANGTVIDSKDYSDQRGKWCGAKSWKQNLKTTYTVTPKSPPLITLCVLTGDFAGNPKFRCGDYPNGDHWKGTIRSTSNVTYAGGAGTCVNEKWLFDLDIYVAADGTVAGRGTGQLKASPQCRLNGWNGVFEGQMHNTGFDVTGKRDGQKFQLFFLDTYRDGKTYGLMDFALLYSGTSLAADMPPFIFSIQGQGSAAGDVRIAYTPANASGDQVTAEHLINLTCLDCSKP